MSHLVIFWHLLPVVFFAVGVVAAAPVTLRKPPGSRYLARTVLTLDGAYPNAGATIGYVITPAMFGFSGLDSYEIVGQDNGFVFCIDPVTTNLRAFRQDGTTGALVELANNSGVLNGLKVWVEGSGW